MGTVRKHGRGWEISYQVAGRRHWETLHVQNRTEAIRVLKIREGQAIDPRNPPELAEAPSVDQLCAMVETDYRFHGRRSLPGLQARLKHLKEYFGDYTSDRIDTEDVREYVRSRQREDAAPGTINRELSVLKRMLNLAVKGGRLHKRPDIPMLPEPAPRQGFFEADQFARVLAELPAYVRPVALFGFHSGWRLSEIVSLRWEQVEREARVVRLWAGTTKNGEGRVLPLVGELWSIVERQWQGRPPDCPWIFYRILKRQSQSTSQHVARPQERVQLSWERISTFYKAWRRACHAGGCPDGIFHDLRRSATRNFRRAGLSETEAMAITGHKTRHVFERYNIVAEQDLKDAVWRAQAFLAGSLAECGKSVADNTSAVSPADGQVPKNSVR